MTPYYSYCGTNNNNNNNNPNSTNNQNTPSTPTIQNQYSSINNHHHHYHHHNMLQDGRVPESQFSISSPSPKKRPFSSSMIPSPPTPTLISNSPYFQTGGSHIVPQFSPQLHNPQPHQQQTPQINSANINPSPSLHHHNHHQHHHHHNQQQNNSNHHSNLNNNCGGNIQLNNLNNNNLNNNNNSGGNPATTGYSDSIYGLSPSLYGGVESPPSMELMEDDIEDQLREYITPVIWNMMDNYGREHLYNSIVEYINEDISFRNFLLELRVIAVMDVNYKSIFQFLVDLFLSIEPNQKMVNFLKDNGVEENELNIDLKALEFSNNENDPNQKKKRERVRKSVSRGLRNPPNKWAKEESQKLIQLVHEHGDKQWKKIAHQIGGGKTGAQCAQHWKRVLCPAIRKGSWDEDEELKLFNLVEKHGQSWKNVASEIRTRTDIQCRYQYFKSCMSREVPWSPREDEILQKKVNENKQEGSDRHINWMEVSKAMARGRQTKIPRTALECKSRWEHITYGAPPLLAGIIPTEDLQQNLQSPSLNSLLQDQIY
eukprot:gene2414-2981_t